MSETDALLTRIAAALERLAPPAPAAFDLSGGRFFIWSPDPSGLAALADPKALPLELLLEMDAQKAAFLANLAQFASGRTANNVLLWGVRGAGKSALARAAIAHFGPDYPQLKLIAVAAADCAQLGALFARLPADESRIVLFLDDLSFEGDEAGLRALKPLLDGGANARSGDILVVATSNRRHLIARDPNENDPSDLIWSDTAEERLALSDRFGLSLGFHALDQQAYLRIVTAYAECLRLPGPAEARQTRAIEWAMTRGARSGRTAHHFIVAEAAAAGIGLQRLYTGGK